MQTCSCNLCRGYPRGYKLFTCKCGCVNVGAILQKKVDQNEVFSLNCIVKGSSPTTCILFEGRGGKGGGREGERQREGKRKNGKEGGRTAGKREREGRRKKKKERRQKVAEMFFYAHMYQEHIRTGG